MRFQILFTVSIIIFYSTGCAVKRQVTTDSGDHISAYRFAPPAHDIAPNLEMISASVKKVYSVASYTTWQFRREQNITGYHIQTGQYRKMATGVISTNETVSGTATVTEQTGNKITLLTCAHIVNAADTLVSYFEPSEEEGIRSIRQISIKENQENWIRDFSACGSFPVTFINKEADIAFLSKTCESLHDSVPVLQCRKGNALSVGLGHFVYVIGYPHGHLMITSGLTSPLPKRPNGEFTVDALLNKGYSGGIVLAVDQSGQFVLVGMVERVSSENHSYLRPPNDQLRTPDWIPYTGPVHVGNTEQIHYGLNQIIPISKIFQ